MKNKTINYTCAIYVRYSGEDDLEEKKGTKSLQNQKESLTQYANENNFNIYKIYEDYFKTGTNMDRPGIKSLFADMKKGLFDVILVKDLSRFSRNYIEAGYYFEEVFPSYNIRFISVADNYDSLVDDELLPIKNYFNTMYSKDLKRKIQKHYEIISTQKEIIKIPKYGYNKTQNGKLIIDPESANVVKKIFSLANEGYNPPRIVEYLINNKIYSPQFYKRFVLNITVNTNTEKLISNPYNWQETQIRNMLRDIEYCGYGKNIVCKDAVNKDKGIILKDAHPAIIDIEYFNKTPKYYTKPLKPRERKYLHKIIRCSKCKRALSFVDSGKYSCPVCHSKIEAKTLETVLYNDCNNLMIDIIKDEKKVLNRFIKAFCEIDVSELEFKNKELTLEIRNLISKRNNISTKSYETEMKRLNKEASAIINQINEVKSKMMSKDELIFRFKKFIKNIKLNSSDKLDLITEVIDSCYISFLDNNELEFSIKYKFNS